MSYSMYNYNSELPLYDKVCRTKKPSLLKKRETRKKENLGIACLLPQEEFSHHEKDAKNRRLFYSAYDMGF